MPRIKTCPTGGSRSIRLVGKDDRGRFKGKAYVAPDVEYYECPACGEKLFGREAMRRIESFRPSRRTRKRKVA